VLVQIDRQAIGDGLHLEIGLGARGEGEGVGVVRDGGVLHIGPQVGADRELIVEFSGPRLRFGSAGRNGLARAKIETLRGHRGLTVGCSELGAFAAARGIDVADHAFVPGAHREIRSASETAGASSAAASSRAMSVPVFTAARRPGSTGGSR